VNAEEIGPVDERVQRRLDDLVRFGADAAHLVGIGRARYLEDSADGRVLRGAGESTVIHVATVVEKLPDSYKAAHEDIAWVAIGRMRNLIAHHYDKIDDRLVFTALEVDIPRLIRMLGLSD
jgi:uncharacterized protein with HEPN domain